jgi:hypothetical protein
MVPGGTPLTSEEQRAASQDAQLREVVAEAFRLLPPGYGGVAGAGAGQGEGVSPKAVDDMVRALFDLRNLTGGDGLGALDWLSTGLATAPPGDGGDLTAAAMRMRDLLMAVLVRLDGGQPPDSSQESEESARAADRFSGGIVQVVDP